MINEKLFKTFKILLGNGRAFNLLNKNINNFSRSLLKPMEELIRIFYKIAFAPFPAQNHYNNASEKLQDIINFEKQFELNTTRATLQERAQNIEAQFGLIGGQGWEYLQKVIQNAGINARIVENIPINNLLSENIIKYGLHQYNSELAMYGKSGFITIGNGILQIEKDITDPVIITNNKSLFLLEHKNGGTLNLTGGQYDILIDLILRIKPLQMVALLNINIQ